MSTTTLDTSAVRRWKRYPEYRGVEVDWLTQVPVHWEVQRVQHRCDPLVGFPFPSEEFLHEPNGIPLVRGDNVTTGSLRWGDKARYWDHSDGRFAKYLLQAGDIVIGMDGSKVGRNYAVVRESDLPLLLLQRVTRLRPHSNLSADFLFYAIANGRFHAHVDAVRTDPAIPHITLKDILVYLLALPPLPEQQTIAAFLDRETARIDALIGHKVRLIALLEEKRQAVISHAVTRGLDPAAPLQDSGVPWLGQVPKHWKLLKLGHLARIGNGSTPERENPAYWQDGDYPWLNSSVVNDAVVSGPSNFVTPTALKECHLPIVPPGSVLVAITGEGKTRGKASVLDFEATINQHMAYLTPIKHRVSPAYLQLRLSADYEVLRMISDGSGSTKGALTCEQLRRFVIPVPPIAEQESIVVQVATRSATSDSLVVAIQLGIDRLHEYRAAVISAAVTGQIDVRGEVAP